MSQEPTYVGIDVAKDQVDVAVRPGGRSWSVQYDEDGVDGLVAQLNRLKPAAVITESTGGLELALVAALAAASLPVAVVNPRQVRDFAKSTGQLAKTDRLDAQVLAHFGEAVRPTIRPLRDADTRELGAMLARRTAGDQYPGGREEPPWSCHSTGSPSHRVPYQLVTTGAQRPRHRPAQQDTSQPAMAGEGRSATQCTRSGTTGIADAACVPTGTGHVEPQADRGVGRGGALQQGQRASSGEAQRMGWSSHGAICIVHGSVGRESSQPCAA